MFSGRISGGLRCGARIGALLALKSWHGSSGKALREVAHPLGRRGRAAALRQRRRLRVGCIRVPAPRRRGGGGQARDALPRPAGQERGRRLRLRPAFGALRLREIQTALVPVVDTFILDRAQRASTRRRSRKGTARSTRRGSAAPASEPCRGALRRSSHPSLDRTPLHAEPRHDETISAGRSCMQSNACRAERGGLESRRRSSPRIGGATARPGPVGLTECLNRPSMKSSHHLRGTR